MISFDEDLAIEDATVLTDLWILARVVSYAVWKLRPNGFSFLFFFSPFSGLPHVWFEGLLFVRILWERGSGGEIISVRWEF